MLIANTFYCKPVNFRKKTLYVNILSKIKIIVEKKNTIRGDIIFIFFFYSSYVDTRIGYISNDYREKHKGMIEINIIFTLKSILPFFEMNLSYTVM